MTQDDRFAPLVHKRDEQPYLVPCLDLTLYFSGDVFSYASAIIDFFEAAVAQVKSDLRFYRTETMTSAKRLKPDTLKLPRFWLLETPTRRDIYMLTVEASDQADTPSDRAVDLGISPGRGHVRLLLPPSLGLQDPAGMLKLALDLARPFPFDWGTFGFGANWHSLGKNSRRAELAMHNLAPRYQGVDFSNPIASEYLGDQGFKCVNWVTFLGKALLSRAPVERQLDALPDDVARVHRLEHGIAVQAGVAPQLGDVNREEDLSQYHSVGRICAPLRARNHAAILGPGGVPDDDETQQWLARFDQ